MSVMIKLIIMIHDNGQQWLIIMADNGFHNG